MNDHELDKMTRKGIEALEKGYIHSAQVFLGQVAEHRNTPEIHTCLAYCLAKGQGRYHSAAKSCQESIKREPNNPLHYLYLGRIRLLAGEKAKAIDAFRQGLKASPDPKIIDELKKLGVRKAPVLKSLKRNHPLNRMLGRISSGLGLRK